MLSIYSTDYRIIVAQKVPLIQKEAFKHEITNNENDLKKQWKILSDKQQAKTDCKTRRGRATLRAIKIVTVCPLCIFLLGFIVCFIYCDTFGMRR